MSRLLGDQGDYRQDPRGRSLGCCGGRLEVCRDGSRQALPLLLLRLHAGGDSLGAGGGAPHCRVLEVVMISCGLSVANWSQYYAGNYPRRLAPWRIAFYTLTTEGWGQTSNTRALLEPSSLTTTYSEAPLSVKIIDM